MLVAHGARILYSMRPFGLGDRTEAYRRQLKTRFLSMPCLHPQQKAAIKNNKLT